MRLYCFAVLAAKAAISGAGTPLLFRSWQPSGLPLLPHGCIRCRYTRTAPERSNETKAKRRERPGSSCAAGRGLRAAQTRSWQETPNRACTGSVALDMAVSPGRGSPRPISKRNQPASPPDATSHPCFFAAFFSEESAFSPSPTSHFTCGYTNSSRPRSHAPRSTVRRRRRGGRRRPWFWRRRGKSG